MSDKGREAIANAVAQIRQSPCNYVIACKKTEEHLRSHGWVHESDVVEGRETKDKCSHQDGDAFQLGACPIEPQVGLACVNCEFYTPKRPATVRDLIGGD